jgi:hypothetical protein
MLTYFWMMIETLHRHRIAFFLSGGGQRDVGLNQEPFVAALFQHGGHAQGKLDLLAPDLTLA